ncbi:desulfoferrodoxin family protein [Acidobacteriota bacterium]
MKNRNYRKIYSAVALACFLLGFMGCSKTETPDKKVSGINNPEAASETDIIFTQNDPGPWGGKEEVHVPKISITETDTGGEVVVTVNHEMNSEKPHFIVWIQIKDSEDNLLGEKTFQDTDEKAEAIFSLPSLPDKITAYSKCNLHGLWSNLLEEKQK